jgi:hypothetical protein
MALLGYEKLSKFSLPVSTTCACCFEVLIYKIMQRSTLDFWLEFEFGLTSYQQRVLA